MKVSIIIRTFNRPLLLKQALASISLQSHKNWEVIIFDDSNGGKDILNIIQNFRKQNPNNTTLYLNSNTPRYFFKKSWEVAPQIANGEVMVRLDDDDILADNTLELISKIYTEHPLLDYSYGSCIEFNENELTKKVLTKTPLEAPKTKNIWAGYLKGHPWRSPCCWFENYYDKPKNYTSIIHCSKANIMCIYHPYVIRTSSALSVLNKFNVVSNYVDDLEVMGSLDHLGLRHTSIKSTLSYVREHDKSRVTDHKSQMREDIITTRDKVEYLRHENFTSNVYLENIEGNNQNEEISDNDKLNFKQYYNKVKLKANQL